MRQSSDSLLLLVMMSLASIRHCQSCRTELSMATILVTGSAKSCAPSIKEIGGNGESNHPYDATVRYQQLLPRPVTHSLHLANTGYLLDILTPPSLLHYIHTTFLHTLLTEFQPTGISSMGGLPPGAGGDSYLHPFLPFLPSHIPSAKANFTTQTTSLELVENTRQTSQSAKAVAVLVPFHMQVL